MNRYDTDTTQTDWSEFEAREKTDRCPITGVAAAPGHLPREVVDEALVGGQTEGAGRSNPKLQAMFDRFLYRK